MTSWLLPLVGLGAQLEDIETPHQSMLDLSRQQQAVLP
jgi:hypothetical protein